MNLSVEWRGLNLNLKLSIVITIYHILIWGFRLEAARCELIGRDPEWQGSRESVLSASETAAI